MDLSQIQKDQKKIIDDRKWNRFNSSQIFTHLIEELGEIASHILYKESYKVKGAGHIGPNSTLKQEFGQSFSLFLQLAIMANIDLEDAWREERDQILKRFSSKEWQQLAKRDQNA